jgi:hypothetical protein
MKRLYDVKWVVYGSTLQAELIAKGYRQLAQWRRKQGVTWVRMIKKPAGATAAANAR